MSVATLGRSCTACVRGHTIIPYLTLYLHIGLHIALTHRHHCHTGAVEHFLIEESINYGITEELSHGVGEDRFLLEEYEWEVVGTQWTRKGNKRQTTTV